MSDEMRPQTHFADSVIAAGGSKIDAIQTAYMITHRLLVEVLEQVGGEVTIPAGLQDRLLDESLTVQTSAHEDGTLKVAVVQTPAAYRSSGPGPGVMCNTFWRRHRNLDDPGIRYRVETVSETGYATMVPTIGGLALEVKTETLLTGADGWRRAE